MNLNSETTTNYINKNVRELNVSPTLRISQICKQKISAGQKIYNLGLGQSPFPVPDSVVNALRLNAAQKDYLHVQGLEEVRKSVAAFHQKKDDLYFNAQDILIGPGSKELLFLLQVVFDAVTLVPSPGWVSYLPQALILGKPITLLETTKKDEWLLQPETLNKFCEKHGHNKPYLLILNYPGNPSGTTYTADQLKAIALVAEKHGVIILSDEIYGRLHHTGNHVSIAKFYPKGTIVSSGISKWCGAGGWRLGTFAFPPQLQPLMKAMAIVASETFTSVSAPIQYAAIYAFACGPDIEKYLWHSRRILKLLGEQLVKIFRDANIEVCDPTGGFYLFLDFENYRETLKGRNISIAAQLCDQLLEEENVAILPGTNFGRLKNELTARLSYVDFDGARALEVSRMVGIGNALPEDFAVHYCNHLTESAQIICNWVRK